MIYHHLSVHQRAALMIESQKATFNVSEFSKHIGCHRSTIYRELKRNHCDNESGRYDADHAASLSFQRRRRGHRKIQYISKLWDFIVEATRCLWSPQQISQYLKYRYPKDITLHVSYNSIYQSIRALPKGELKKDLLSHFRHLHKGKKVRDRPSTDTVLKDIRSIHERPDDVNERKIPGHWEADLIKGKDNKSAIATLIERNTRLCILAKLPNASALSVKAALTEAMQYLPEELRKTLTYDRGREMALHQDLERDVGIEVYFCDPHSPWQKGTCENMNGLIRQYLPKGIDLNPASQEYLNQIAMSLNCRPRKALNWQTPLEAFSQFVDVHQAFKSVAPHA